MERLFPFIKIALAWGRPPSNIWFLGPTRVHNPRTSRSVQPVMQGSQLCQTDRQTDRSRYSVYVKIDRIYIIRRCGLIILTPGYWWRGGWHNERNVSARINRVLLGAHRETATREAADYQLPSDADERYPGKLHCQADCTQQLALLHNSISVYRQCIPVQ